MLLKTRKAIKRVLDVLPFLQCLSYFPLKTHAVAGRKLLTLWALSTLPVFLAVLFAKKTGSPIADNFLTKLSESISVTEQFVYSAAFLTPIFYIIFEKFSSIESRGSSLGEIKSQIGIFKGYWLVAITCFLVLIVTASSYTSLKTNPELFSATYIYDLLIEGSWIVYLFAIYCWYLSFLDGAYVVEFESTVRETENNAQASFSERIRQREQH